MEFDLLFEGTPALGERVVRDVKGTVWFRDAFGEPITAIGATKRLNVGSGRKVRISGLTVDYTIVHRDLKWEQVLAKPREELQVRFDVEKIIYAE